MKASMTFWYLVLFLSRSHLSLLVSVTCIVEHPLTIPQTTVAKEEMKHISNPAAFEMHIVYYPQIGFQVALPRSLQPISQTVDALPEFEYQVSEPSLL
jgi:hypothetical protein